MVALYNDIDPYCCSWLENLIGNGELPYGLVSSKHIRYLGYNSLEKFSECHFFAGIGGWPLALRWANWPSNELVWTGSCPCQPFSMANIERGKTGDDRHLWPDFLILINKYRPATIFGEQIAGPDGKIWLSTVRFDLEKIGYAFGAANLPACSIEAPHVRQRLFWVADSSSERLERFEHRRESLRSAAKEASTKFNNNIIREKFQFLSSPNSLPDFNGISRPVDIIRSFGNAIVPLLATQFILAFMKAI